nr:hypothetical protein [Tanacetum cinerariifolium]
GTYGCILEQDVIIVVSEPGPRLVEPSEQLMHCYLVSLLGSPVRSVRMALGEVTKHFKWALCDWILDEIVNTEFADVAQVANATRNMEILHERSGQKGYPDYASSPPCDVCGKLHPGKACHKVTRACYTCGSTGHMARDCPKNGGNGGKGNGNDNQPAAKGHGLVD